MESGCKLFDPVRHIMIAEEARNARKERESCASGKGKGPPDLCVPKRHGAVRGRATAWSPEHFRFSLRF